MFLLALDEELFGQGFGPLVVGMLSDFYATTSGATSLKYALITSSVFLVWLAIHYFLAIKHYLSDIEAAQRNDG